MHAAVPEGLKKTLATYSKFTVIGHQEPDGDCLSSQWALASFLKRGGAKPSKDRSDTDNEGAVSILVSPGPFTRSEISSMQEDFLLHIPEEFRGSDTLTIVVDCSTVDRIGYLAEEVGDSPIAVIDHHASGSPFGDIRYIDVQAPSVTYMIQKIIEEYGHTPTAEEADTLLFGLATDTGFFRHLGKGSAAVLHSAARLVEAGASPSRVHGLMYGGRPLESRTLLGRLLARTEGHFGGKLLITYETLEEKQHFGEENRDSDSLYQHLQGVENSEVVILIRRETLEKCSVGLRSKHAVDVGKIAKAFGGGGHPRAAGFERKSTIEKTADELIEMLRSHLTSPQPI